MTRCSTSAAGIRRSRSLIEDVPVGGGAFRDSGVRVVVVHVLGPDVADLDYLDRFERNLFTPDAVLIVRNSGLITNGRSYDVALRSGEQASMRVLRRDAEGAARRWCSCRVSACMSEVTDRGLSFAEAMNGKVWIRTERPLSIFDRLRVQQVVDGRIAARYLGKSRPSGCRKCGPRRLGRAGEGDGRNGKAGRSSRGASAGQGGDAGGRRDFGLAEEIARVEQAALDWGGACRCAGRPVHTRASEGD